MKCARGWNLRQRGTNLRHAENWTARWKAWGEGGGERKKREIERDSNFLVNINNEQRRKNDDCDSFKRDYCLSSLPSAALIIKYKRECTCSTLCTWFAWLREYRVTRKQKPYEGIGLYSERKKIVLGQCGGLEWLRNLIRFFSSS